MIRSNTNEVTLPALPRRFEMLLHRLPLSYDEAIEEALSVGSPALETLQALAVAGALQDAVVDPAGEDLAVAYRPDPQADCRGRSRRVRLGEHVSVRPLPAKWVVTRPSTPTTISLRSDLAGALLCDLVAAIDTDALSEIGKLFLDNGFLVGEPGPHSPWEFHDAVFHGATASGYGTDGGYGATSAKPMSSSKSGADRFPATNGRMVDLADGGTYPAGIEVLARRRTQRDFCAEPIPLHALSCLLGLALRTQSVTALSPTDYYALHPYPSGGARDEITTLVAYGRDEKGEAFLSSYLNREHKLFRYHQSQEQALEAIEALSAVCHVGKPGPGAALLFAADYERMATKYEAIAYATILRNVGAIYQTVCLVAEALGLAACAVGGGWGRLERQTLSAYLGNRVIVGGILVGIPAGRPGHDEVPV